MHSKDEKKCEEGKMVRGDRTKKRKVTPFFP
jgi:hypothetical protein